MTQEPTTSQDARGAGADSGPHQRYVIHIDRQQYRVAGETVTGEALRALPPVPDSRDLFQKVPGGLDILIAAGDVVRLKDGLHFFTAPRNVTPGGIRDHCR
jgi:hypothetical protein